MSDNIINRSASVFIAEARVDQRGAMREALKQLGFKNVKTASTVKEIWDLLEVEDRPPDWIITGLMPGESINAMHILALCLKETSLHNCKISLVLAPEEKYCLPRAFELGLLSYHMSPFTKSSLEAELKAMIDRLTIDESNGCLTAAFFLRGFLLERETFKAAIKLDEALLRLYPQKAELFINLAEDQQMGGDNGAALRTLSQAKYMGTDVSKAAKQIEAMINADAPAEKKEDATRAASFAMAFGIKYCVLIDTDEAIIKMLQAAMTELGVENVLCFGDGNKAWEWIETNCEHVNVIIQEWRIPGLTAPALIQRYRAKNITAPVIIFSSLVKTGDKNILREMGVAQVIEKPLDKDLFMPAFMTTLRQEEFPTSYRVIARKIQLAISAGDITTAKSLHKSLTAVEQVPEHVMQTCEAEILCAEGDLEGAKALVFEATKNSGDSLRLLNLMAKIYMKLRKFDDAMKCMGKAQEMSSGNLERLCMLAEAQGEVGDIAAAKSTLEKAKTIDAESEEVLKTDAKIAITAGDSEQAKKIIENMDSLGDIAAYMNNRAVSLSKQDKLKEAVELYETALRSLPERETALIAKINYNLSLGYIRSGDMKKALTHAEKAAVGNIANILDKASSLKTRLAQAVGAGKTIQLKTEDKFEVAAKKPVSALPTRQLILATDVNCGDMCCHLIYYAEVADSVESDKLLAKIPSFNPRQHKTLQRQG